MKNGIDGGEHKGISFVTVRAEAIAEYVEKRSRFIASVFPVDLEDAALVLLGEVKQKYRDARHNVYAYVIREQNRERYSDDGEPSGTAGTPVLEVIKKEGLSNVLIVVTRYFGGTLLGAGGLVRAYSKAAKMALDEAGRKKMRLCKEAEIVCTYGFVGRVQACAAEIGAATGKSEYSENARLSFFVPLEDSRKFEKDICEATLGSSSLVWTNEAFCDMI